MTGDRDISFGMVVRRIVRQAYHLEGWVAQPSVVKMSIRGDVGEGAGSRAVQME